MTLSIKHSSLDEVGDLSAPPGSRPWAVAVRRRIQSRWDDARMNSTHLWNMLHAIEEHAGYRHLEGPDGHLFGTYRAFCEARPPFGLGIPPHVIDRLIAGNATDAIDAIIAERKTIAQRDAEDQRQQRPPRRPPKTGNNVPNSTRRPEGNTAEKGLRRLRKDRPDLHQRVLAGEVSAHAAMVLAGFRTKTITVPAEPRSLAAALLRQLGPEDLAIVLAELRAHSEQGYHSLVGGDA